MNQGTTQGSARGPHHFNSVFINDLAIRDNELTSIVKYVDDTTLLVEVFNNKIDLCQEVVNQFFSWTQDNAMACNPKKCNELILCKKDAHDINPVNNLTQISCLKVYASSIPELTTFQNFLQRCFKRKYISYQIDVYDVLEEVDHSLFKKTSSVPGHPLYPSVPKTKESSAHLRVPSSQFPRVNTQGFENSVFNGLFFKYRVAI